MVVVLSCDPQRYEISCFIVCAFSQCLSEWPVFFHHNTATAYIISIWVMSLIKGKATKLKDETKKEIYKTDGGLDTLV